LKERIVNLELECNNIQEKMKEQIKQLQEATKGYAYHKNFKGEQADYQKEKENAKAKLEQEIFVQEGNVKQFHLQIQILSPKLEQMQGEMKNCEKQKVDDLMSHVRWESDNDGLIRRFRHLYMASLAYNSDI